MPEGPLSHVQKLNLGCGPVQPHGWINVDASMRAWLASRLSWLDRLLVQLRVLPPTEFNRQTTFANLMRRLPWDDGSVDCIYMGEVLEHFTRDEGAALLAECFRVLRTGGVLRLRVPDNATFWRNYIRDFDKAFTKPRSEWTDTHTRWIEMFFHDICVRRRFLGSYGHYHKWMYDEISLVHAFERTGFVDVRRREYLDSAIADVSAVENRPDLIVEGRKAGVH